MLQRNVRPAAGWNVGKLGPAMLPDGTLTLRRPRFTDGVAWSRARLANRRWLERAFPAWGDDWAAEQNEAAWIQRWWRLRTLNRDTGAQPFVILLDDRLIGEIGVDAVDTVSGCGEASVWMVADHGSPQVFGAATMLCFSHILNVESAVDRVFSPVATTSRAGRSPGLTAAGFQLEGTVPRFVRGRGFVDHDMWVLLNSATSRAMVDTSVAAMTGGGPGATGAPPARATDAVAMVPAAGRVALRITARTARSCRASAITPRPPAPPSATSTRVDNRVVRVEHAPTGRGRLITVDGAVVGTVATSVDLGTATATVTAQLQGPAPDRAVLHAAVGLTVSSAAQWAPDCHLVEVRVPTDDGARPGSLPDPAMLTELGLTHGITHGPNPEGWDGEQRWYRAVP